MSRGLWRDMSLERDRVETWILSTKELRGISDQLFSWRLVAFSQLVFSRAFDRLFGEFDPGSGRTLAARLTHASRTLGLRPWSGGRVRNT